MDSIINKLEEGIWIIRNIKDGTQIKKIHERVDELPKAIKKAELELHRYEMTKALHNEFVIRDQGGEKCILGNEVNISGYGEITLPSVTDVINTIFKSVK